MTVSLAQVRQYVLGDFHRRWPQAVGATDLRKNLRLNDPQIWGIGQELIGWKGVSYSSDEFLKCKTINEIIALIYYKLTGSHFDIAAIDSQMPTGNIGSG